MPARAPGTTTLQVGATVSRALGAWFVLLPKSVVVAAVALIPWGAWLAFREPISEFLSWLVLGDVEGPDPLRPGPRAFPVLIDQLVRTCCVVIGIGMVLDLTFRRLTCAPGSIGRAIASGADRLVPLALIGLLMAAFTVIPILYVVLRERSWLADVVDLVRDPAARAKDLERMYWITQALVVVGAMARVAAEVFLAAVLGAVVVERRGLSDSFRRGFALTHGVRRRALGCVVVITIVVFTIAALIGLLGRLLPATFADADDTGAMLLIVPLSGAFAATIYHDQRAAKEGVAVDDLVRVFV